MADRPSLRRWENLTSTEIAALGESDPVAVLPTAAIEQHGPHLPVGTDVVIGEGILDAALEGVDPGVEIVRLPTLAAGASPEHLPIPGTVDLSPEGVASAVEAWGDAVVRSGIRRLVLANSHGGNRAALETAGLALRERHRMLVVKAHWFRFPRPDGVDLPEAEWRHGLHGGAVETSMMLHLAPDLVRREEIAAFPSLGADLEGTLDHLGPEGTASFAWLAEDLHPEGVTGDATLATAETGARLVEGYARVLAGILADAAHFPLDRLAPRPGGTGP